MMQPINYIPAAGTLRNHLQVRSIPCAVWFWVLEPLSPQRKVYILHPITHFHHDESADRVCVVFAMLSRIFAHAQYTCSMQVHRMHLCIQIRSHHPSLTVVTMSPKRGLSAPQAAAPANPTTMYGQSTAVIRMSRHHIFPEPLPFPSPSSSPSPLPSTSPIPSPSLPRSSFRSPSGSRTSRSRASGCMSVSKGATGINPPAMERTEREPARGMEFLQCNGGNEVSPIKQIILLMVTDHWSVYEAVQYLRNQIMLQVDLTVTSHP